MACLVFKLHFHLFGFGYVGHLKNLSPLWIIKCPSKSRFRLCICKPSCEYSGYFSHTLGNVRYLNGSWAVRVFRCKNTLGPISARMLCHSFHMINIYGFTLIFKLNFKQNASEHVRYLNGFRPMGVVVVFVEALSLSIVSNFIFIGHYIVLNSSFKADFKFIWTGRKLQEPFIHVRSCMNSQFALCKKC